MVYELLTAVIMAVVQKFEVIFEKLLRHLNLVMKSFPIIITAVTSIVRLKCDGTRTETRFRLSPKRTSPFKSAGASVQLTAGSRGVHISISNAGYTTFRGSVRVLATHSICQLPLHFPSHASPCAIRFQTHSTLYHFGLQHLIA